MWTRQAVLDKVCRLIRWRALKDRDMRDWIYHIYHLSRGLIPAQADAETILRNHFLQPAFDFTPLLHEVQTRMKKIQKKKPFFPGELFAFLFNVSRALPAEKSNSLWPTSPWPSPLSLLTPLQVVHPDTVLLFFEWLGHRLLLAPSSPDLPFKATLYRGSHGNTLRIHLEGGCIPLPYFPDLVAVTLKTHIEASPKDTLSWMARVLEACRLQETYKRDSPATLPSHPIPAWQAAARSCLQTTQPFIAQMGYGLLIDCFQPIPTKRPQQTLSPLFRSSSLGNGS